MYSVPNHFILHLTKNQMKKRGCKKCQYLGVVEASSLYPPPLSQTFRVTCDTVNRICNLNEAERIERRNW